MDSTKSHIAMAVGIVAVSGAAGFCIGKIVERRRSKSNHINKSIEKDCDKVASIVDMEDIANNEKTALCRCWKSKKFPYCDGSHNKHNVTTGDNVGPVVIKK